VPKVQEVIAARRVVPIAARAFRVGKPLRLGQPKGHSRQATQGVGDVAAACTAQSSCEHLSRSALHAQDLLQLSHDLHQVCLLRHHMLDVLVGFGRFVNDAAILTTLHALGLTL